MEGLMERDHSSMEYLRNWWHLWAQTIRNWKKMSSFWMVWVHRLDTKIAIWKLDTKRSGIQMNPVFSWIWYSGVWISDGNCTSTPTSFATFQTHIRLISSADKDYSNGCKMALSVLAEFKNLGLLPSLGAYKVMVRNSFLFLIYFFLFILIAGV